MEREDQENACKINTSVSYVPKTSVSYVPKTEDPSGDLINVIDDDIEHKKATHPYVPPQVQTAPTIELETQKIDNKFVKLKEQFDRVGNVAAEQKKAKTSCRTC